MRRIRRPFPPSSCFSRYIEDSSIHLQPQDGSRNPGFTFQPNTEIRLRGTYFTQNFVISHFPSSFSSLCHHLLLFAHPIMTPSISAQPHSQWVSCCIVNACDARLLAISLWKLVGGKYQAVEKDHLLRHCASVS